MPDVEVQFVTKADPAGAKQTAEGIKEVKQAVESAAPAQKELAKASQEVAKAGKEAVEVDEKGVVSKKDLREAVTALKQQIPELGSALNLLRSPYAVLAAGIGLAVAELRRFNAEVDEAERRIEKFANLSAEFGRFQQVAQASKERAADFAKAWGEMAVKGMDALSVVNQITTALQEQSKAQGELDDQTATAAQRAEAGRIRERNEQSKQVEALKAAAQVEAERVGEARFALPGAIKAQDEAEREALKQEFAAEATADDVGVKLKEVREKIRKAKERVRTAPEHDIEVDPNAKFGVAMGRAQAQRILDELEDEAKGLVNQRIDAEVLARGARRKADDAGATTAGHRKTILESTDRGRGFNEQARNLHTGVLRNAARDPGAERSRSPALPAAPQADAVTGEIVKFAAGLNTTIDTLMRSFQNLNAMIAGLQSRVQQMESQNRTGGRL